MRGELDAEVQSSIGERYYQNYEGHGCPMDGAMPLPAKDFLAAISRGTGYAYPGSLYTRVIDLGCGTGKTIMDMRALGLDAFGIELSSFTFTRIEEQARPYAYWMDATNLAIFPDGAFDFAVANMTPHVHPDQMVDWLKDVRRITSRGIYLRYMTPEWVEAFKARTHGDNVNLYVPWTKPAYWWADAFTAARLRTADHWQDDSWDCRVVLVPA